MSGYVIITKNFKSFSLQIYHSVNEVLIFMFYILIYLGIYNEEYQISSGYAYFCIYFISSAMILNISFFAVIKTRELCQKISDWKQSKNNKVVPLPTVTTEISLRSNIQQYKQRYSISDDIYHFGNRTPEANMKNFDNYLSSPSPWSKSKHRKS